MKRTTIGILGVALMATQLSGATPPEAALPLRTALEQAMPVTPAQRELPRRDVEPSKTSKSLEERVRTELLKLPYYGVFDFLAFQIDGERVRLSGEASWPTLKTDAERAVCAVEGVRGVVNDIKVLPVSPHDDQIRLATYWAVYGHAALAPYRLNPHPPIRIIVENGNVTLKGVVRNQMDRSVAHLMANGVPGTFSVTNNLQLGS